jgi:hypothetical protein
MTVVGGNVTGSWASMMGYVPASALAAKVGGGAMASPDAAAGTSSLDLHALAKEMLEARARADQSAVARVYPDAITVTISY